MGVKMKLLVSLGLIAYASALHERHCNNFITVVRSRNKRSPQWGWGDDATSTAGVTSTAGSTTAVHPTAAPTTQASTNAATDATTESTAAPGTTQPPTTEASTTAGGYSTTAGVEGEGTDYSILLDATGSMQKLSGPGRGRDFVISRFNKFLKTLRTQVERGNIEDGKIAVATFNKGAKWSEYNSIKNVADLTKRTYNPGYGTNLYDTIGCALQKFKDESSAATKLVYILTDGNHQVYPNTVVAHTVDEVADHVNSYRDEEGMQFSFLALINPEDKEPLKKSANQMGIRDSEIRTSDFNGREFTVCAPKKLCGKKNSSPTADRLPSCDSLKKLCKRGKAGKFCRKSVARKKAFK